MADMQILEISQDILDSARLSVQEMRLELAITLYAQKRLSIGKACQLADMSLWELRQILAARRIESHYTVEDLNEDVETLRALGRL
jgi:predicted HTH domain antitoxin